MFREEERPQHELIASPWLSNGQIAAIKLILDEWLDAEAALWLDDPDMAEVEEQVSRGMRFDPARLTGTITSHKVFVARTVYWANQVLRALENHKWPVPEGEIGVGGAMWLDENGQPIDPVPEEEP